MRYKPEIIRTDNLPLVDEMVYNLKLIITDCVLKDQDKADKCETLKSAQNASQYISAVQNRVRFDVFRYTPDMLRSIGVPERLIDDYMKDRNNIPERFRKPLLEYATKYYVNNYEELNNYYRMLNGKPNVGEEGIYLVRDRIDLDNIDYTKPLHEQNSDTLDYLYKQGVIDELIESYPSCKYLNHLGSRSINPLTARLSKKFGLLYISDEANDIVINRFKEKFELNRDYTLKTIYSDAYKFGSRYYDNFIMVLIILQTMLDMFSEIPDIIIKGELFDLRTIQIMFESYGIDFYPDIPFRYQSAMLRNVNRLIKFKSTTKNIVDICSLFGFDNIFVFKYYILKIHRKDEEGYIFKYNEKGEEDIDKMYDLKFLKIPVEDMADDYLQDTSKYLNYDTITTGDQYWDGELDHEYVKHIIMDHEFNYVRSKYLSIDTVYSMTELSFQLCYFYNMIFNDDRFEELLKVSIPYVDTTKDFKLLDTICYLLALGYESRGIKDKLMDTTGKALSVMGFNFKVNLNELRAYYLDKGYTLEDLGIEDFQIPQDQILSYKQLLKIYTTNKEIHDHVVYEITHADNYKIYKIYEDIYNALFIMDFNTEVFRKSNGELATTYTDFLEDRDPVLFKSLKEIKAIKNKDTKIDKINTIITNATYALQEFLDSDDLKYIFNLLPAVSAEAIKHYIYEVVNFFKSFKMEILSINTIYKFDDRLENRIKMIDDVILNHNYTWSTIMDIYDKLKFNVHLTYSERIELKEKIYKEITYWVNKLFGETIFDDDSDRFAKLQVHNNYSDKVCIEDRLGNRNKNSIKCILERVENLLCIKEKMKYNVNVNYKEKLDIKELIYKEITYWVDKFFIDDIPFRDEMKKYINLNYKEKVNIKEDVKISIF